MLYNRIYNFSAGPSMLPIEVLESARDNLVNFEGCGMSVMEMSHRSKVFDNIIVQAEAQLRKVMGIPDNYKVIFMQGGATLQFAAVPLNLMNKNHKADYVVTGNFSGLAAKEAEKYGSVHIACDSSDRGHSYIPPELSLSAASSYFYYCANNTIYGTEWQSVPDTKGKTIVCDMSSDILSKPVDVSKFGLIYAGAQKNMAPAGLTVVIVDKALAGRQMDICPSVMSYDTLIKKDSMLNTPPCWCIYMLGLMLDWLAGIGGVAAMEEIKKERAGIIYDVLDNSKLYIPHAERDSRSDMNVTFRTDSAELDAKFVKEATEHGLCTLKGHKLVGGMRASIYNAMPVEGIKALVEFMAKFERENG